MMPQVYQVRGVATSIRTEDDWTHVRYHNTDVVSFNASTIVLRTGGWCTAATKLRMNQTANQYGLDFQVYQKNHTWRVRTRTEDMLFGDGADEHIIIRDLL